MDDQIVDTATVTVAVRASDDHGLVAVTYLTDRASSGTCAQDAVDTYACGPIDLVVGTNAVLVRAVDGAGNAASLVLRVQRAPPEEETPPEDVTPPSLALFGLDDGAVVTTESVVVTAVAADASGVASVTYATDHGATGACGLDTDNAYTCGPVPIPIGDTVLTVRAIDTAGNAASATRLVRREAPDVTPPTLTITGLADGAVVTEPSILLTAAATDEGGVASVTYATDHGATGACGPPSGNDYPCGPIPLPVGETELTVTARDVAGNAASDVRHVRREEVVVPAEFDIDLIFFDHMLVPSQLTAFAAAAGRWEGVVTGDLVDLPANLPPNGSCGYGEPAYAGTIDDIVVFVTTFTEAPGGLLGYAGPCLLRTPGTDGGLSAVGYMAFDTLDLASLEASGTLQATIVHELGHVLGFGTLWEVAPYFDLLDYAPIGASDCRSATGYVVPPTFTGTVATAAWHALGGAGGVPVEDEGGPGTRCGHWDEGTFGAELMTGWLNVGGANPLSGVTIGSLEDLGYAVDVSAADPYVLPGVGALAEGDRVDLAGREILVRPRGAVDPVGGAVAPFAPVAPPSR
ncbi:MAG: leishmanolysin-related zinc metalloendopeptidase [Trueperaceae bacterium]